MLASGNRRHVDRQTQPLACPTVCEVDEERLVDDKAAAEINLLRGNVPSPSEWKDAWASTTERDSLRKDARVLGKKAASGDERNENKHRKQMRQQLFVMVEELRRRIRDAFRQATSISLALDESRYGKIIRFRADLPTAQAGRSHLGASGFTLSGVLGILD